MDRQIGEKVQEGEGWGVSCGRQNIRAKCTYYHG